MNLISYINLLNEGNLTKIPYRINFLDQRAIKRIRIRLTPQLS